MPAPDCRLYLITPPAIADLPAFLAALDEALSAGDVAALQVRLKDVADAEIEGVTRAILPVAQARGVAVILNDRPDLAARLNCDGVHIGQGDGTYAEARRAVGPQRMVGVTCHDSRHLAMEAAEAGADYVAFGAVFPTATKDAPTQCELEVLTIWQQTMQTPCVAIGGITAENCGPVVAAGADFLAVCGYVWSHPQGPGAGVEALMAAIAEGLKGEERSPVTPG
jgi:thiamine-phosphate pyrophosphorylase